MINAWISKQLNLLQPSSRQWWYQRNLCGNNLLLTNYLRASILHAQWPTYIKMAYFPQNRKYFYNKASKELSFNPDSRIISSLFVHCVWKIYFAISQPAASLRSLSKADTEHNSRVLTNTKFCKWVILHYCQQMR